MSDKPIPAARKRRTSVWPYVFLGPFLILMLAFFVYPLFGAMGLAFYQTYGARASVFVGVDNFSFLLSDPDFHSAIKNTLVFALCSLLIQLPIALGLALLLNRARGRSQAFFRLVLFAPNLVGPIFVGLLFSVLFAPRYGLVGQALQALVGWGIDQRWLDEPALAMPAMVISSLWMYVGFNMVFFLAALQNADASLEDAARVDGANSLQIFWHVTVPAIAPVAGFVVTMSLIGSLQLFELPLALWGGNSGFGPDNAGLTMLTYLNEVAFNRGDLGLGSAVGWLLALLILAIGLTRTRLAATFARRGTP